MLHIIHLDQTPDTSKLAHSLLLERINAVIEGAHTAILAGVQRELGVPGSLDLDDLVCVAVDGSDSRTKSDCIRSVAARELTLGKPFHDPMSLHPRDNGFRGGVAPLLGAHFPGARSVTRVLVCIERTWMLVTLEQGTLLRWVQASRGRDVPTTPRASASPAPVKPSASRSA